MEKKEVKGLGIILTIAQAILHEGMADEHDDTLYERKVWCPTVVGKVVPIKIIESKIIIEGELAKTMDVEVVSSTGVWTLEICSTRGADKDDMEAVESYRKAAEHGDAVGQVNLGSATTMGKEVRRRQ